jgi:hypothetical protein
MRLDLVTRDSWMSNLTAPPPEGVRSRLGECGQLPEELVRELMPFQSVGSQPGDSSGQAEENGK